MKQESKANIALLTTVILWSFHAVAARGIIQNLPPFTVHFFRMFTAFFAFLPFFLQSRCWKKDKFLVLLGVSLFAAINMTLFMWGIQYTTASASQLIYAAMPVLIVFLNLFLLGKSLQLHKIIGVLLGFFGIVFIVYLSGVEEGKTISGSLTGNLAIAIAMSSWLTYLLLSKKLSKYFSPIELGSVSILVSLVTSIPLFTWEVVSFKVSLSFNINQLLAMLYMGIGGTFVTYILYQYAIKYCSPLKVSLTSYIQPITTAILAMIFLAERLTVNFILGSLMVFGGIFFATTYEIISKNNT